MSKKTIIITGASGGLGLSLVEKFLFDYHVIAGVRKDDDYVKLRDMGAEPFYLDLTNKTHLMRLKERLLKVSHLKGLINNAGVTGISPLEISSRSQRDLVMETNLNAVMDLTAMCIPRLREHGGVIVNVGSTSGVIGAPLGSVYAASKFALKGLSEALYRELAPQNIKVIHAIPGAIKTNIWTNMSKSVSSQILNANPRETWSYRGFISLYEKVEQQIEKYAMESHAVADIIFTGFHKKNPPRDLVIGSSAKLQYLLKKVLPQKLLEILLKKRFSSPLHPPIDWSGKKYEAIENLGEEVDTFFITGQNNSIENVFLRHHGVSDGMGSLTDFFAKFDLRLFKHPTIKSMERPSFFKLVKYFFAYMKASKGPKYAWQDFKEGRGKHAPSDHLFIHCDEKLTKDLARIAKEHQSGMNALVLSLLNNCARKQLLKKHNQPLTNWLLPVNFRGADGRDFDLRNRTTSLCLNINEKDLPQNVHENILDLYTQGMPWGSWLHSNVVKVTGVKVLEWIYRRVKPSQYLGVFSNLGIWPNDLLLGDVPNELEHLFLGPPSVSLCPLTCAAVSWRGKLHMSVRIHRDFTGDPEALNIFLKNFEEEVYGLSQAGKIHHITKTHKEIEEKALRF